MMTFDTKHGPIQIPIDVQATSKVANEKRSRNAKAAHSFRQRRKQNELEAKENIDKLRAKIRKVKEEKDHYRNERDYFRDVAFRNHLSIEPRPLSPEHKRYASYSGVDLCSFSSG